MSRAAGEPIAESRSIDGVEVAVVGAGQAGLAIGYYLKHQGRRFVIVERAGQIAPAWRERWESLTLFTPCRYSALPGAPSPAIPTAIRRAMR
jgi:putative flavoprotein involved in K+ transport